MKGKPCFKVKAKANTKWNILASEVFPVQHINRFLIYSTIYIYYITHTLCNDPFHYESLSCCVGTHILKKRHDMAFIFPLNNSFANFRGCSLSILIIILFLPGPLTRLVMPPYAHFLFFCIGWLGQEVVFPNKNIIFHRLLDTLTIKKLLIFYLDFTLTSRLVIHWS